MLAVAFHAELGEDERLHAHVPRPGPRRRAPGARGRRRLSALARRHRSGRTLRYKGAIASQPHVAALSTTPVKSLRIQRRERVLLERGGARGDRAMFIVDERGRMINAKRHPALNQVVAELDDDGRARARASRTARRVAGEPRPGEELQVRFYSLIRPARAIDGPFSQALSEHAGAPLRLVAFEGGRSAVDRGAQGAATRAVPLLGRRARGGRRARADRHPALPDDDRARRLRAVRRRRLDRARAARRRRRGCAPLGHVGRCTVTTLDPDSGEVDLPTLDLLRELRGGAETTEPLAIGVHCAVIEPGEVALGDPVEVEG